MKSRNRKKLKSTHWWRHFKYGKAYYGERAIDRAEDMELRLSRLKGIAQSIVNNMRTAI